MSNQISGTITRKSNGTMEFTPADGAAFSALPSMGDEVTLDVTVIRTAAQIEHAAAVHKAERVAPEPEVAPVPATRRARP